MADTLRFLSLRIGAKRTAMDITAGPQSTCGALARIKQPVSPDAEAIAAAKGAHRPAASAGYN